MNKEMQVKSQVLDMLEKFLMGGSGSKFKPDAMTVEVIHAKPMKGKEGLEDVLDQASEDNPIDEMAGMHEEPDGDEYCEGGMAKGGKAGYSKGGAVEGTGLDEPGGFEDMDLEHVDDDNYEPKKKHMSLKEFMRNK